MGDDYLLVDAPKSFSGRTAMDQEEAKPFSPSLVDPDVNMIQEDLDAQLNELQSIVSSHWHWQLDCGATAGCTGYSCPPSSHWR